MTKRERQLAEYAAEGVSECSPVAWAARPPIGNDSGWLFFSGKEAAESCASIAPGWDVVPLFTQPTLTEEERDALAESMEGYIAWSDDNCHLDAPEVQAILSTIRRLLGER